MTTITNLVVALMIVTTGEEQVRAVPVREIPHEGGVYETYSFERETLWRKVNQTNFVFSAMINTPIPGVCHAPNCWAEISCDIDALFGRPIAWFGVHAGANAYCEKHKDTMDDEELIRKREDPSCRSTWVGDRDGFIWVRGDQ